MLLVSAAVFSQLGGWDRQAEEIIIMINIFFFFFFLLFVCFSFERPYICWFDMPFGVKIGTTIVVHGVLENSVVLCTDTFPVQYAHSTQVKLKLKIKYGGYF